MAVFTTLEDLVEQEHEPMQQYRYIVQFKVPHWAGGKWSADIESDNFANCLATLHKRHGQTYKENRVTWRIYDRKMRTDHRLNSRKLAYVHRRNAKEDDA